MFSTLARDLTNIANTENNDAIYRKPGAGAKATRKPLADRKLTDAKNIFNSHQSNTTKQQDGSCKNVKENKCDKHEATTSKQTQETFDDDFYDMYCHRRDIDEDDFTFMTMGITIPKFRTPSPKLIHCNEFTTVVDYPHWDSSPEQMRSLEPIDVPLPKFELDLSF